MIDENQNLNPNPGQDPNTPIVPEVPADAVDMSHESEPTVVPVQEEVKPVEPVQSQQVIPPTPTLTSKAPTSNTITILGVTLDKQMFMYGAAALVLLFIILIVSFASGALFGNGSGNTSTTTAEFLAPNEPQMIVRIKNPKTGTYSSILDPLNLSSPMELQFDTRKTLPKSTPEYKISKYEWDLNGDGRFTDTEGDGPLVTYAYKDAGTNGGVFEVSLRVTKEILAPHAQYQKIGEIVTETYGPGKETGGYTFKITTERPEIDLRTTPTVLEGVVPFEVIFDASRSSAKDGIDEVSWDFDGDGVADEKGAKVTHTFTKEGTIEVNLTVTDKNGAESSQKIEVIVDEAQLPVSAIDASVLSGESPLKVKFSGAKSTTKAGQIVEYLWKYGDGSKDEKAKETEHTFAKPGKYTVSLMVTTDQGTTNTSQVIIEVSTSKGAPTARIKADGEGGDGVSTSGQQEGILRGKIPLKVTFDGSVSQDPEKDIVTWKWNLSGGDEYDATGAIVTNVFKTPGSYPIKLYVEDSSGNTSETTMTVIVEADDFVVNLVADPLSGVAPKKVAFDASASSYSRGQIASYEWDFGDGSPKKLSGAIQTHEYTSPGTYTVTVKARATDGTLKQGTIIITMLEQDLIPVMTFSPQTGTAPLSVDFDASESVGNIVSYRWDFGDGETATGIRTTHLFKLSGKYNVILMVQDESGGLQKLTKQVSAN